MAPSKFGTQKEKLLPYGQLRESYLKLFTQKYHTELLKRTHFHYMEDHMPDELKDVDRPFRVITIPDGNFHSGHMEKEHADIRAEQANKDAIALGILTRYQTVETVK